MFLVCDVPKSLNINRNLTILFREALAQIKTVSKKENNPVISTLKFTVL